jgi:diguanylate cyclase (GGDEF)-like protein/PAS domain S-box-containing protein
MNVLTDTFPIRLLLVDDDSADRLVCRRALEQSGHDFSIHEAETAEQGLRLARSERFDCILLDHYLPDFNGLEFLADLGEDSGGLPAPVVMITGANDATVAMRALKLGASDYVVKRPARESLEWVPAIVVRVLRERKTFLEKQEAVEQLRKAEAKYRGLVEQMPSITYIASIEEPGKLLYISPQIGRLGYPPEAWLDDPQGLLGRVYPDDREHVIEQFAGTYEHHAPLRCEYRLIDKNGRAGWFLDEAKVVHGEDGRALFLQGLLVDITEHKEIRQELDGCHRRMDLESGERKQAEAALRASEAHLRLLLESAGEGIFGLDAEGRCTFVNPAALDLFGDGSEALLDRDMLTTLSQHRVDGELYPGGQCPLLRTLREGVPSRFTETLRRRDGGSFAAEFSAYPLPSESGVAGAVIVMRDVSEVRALTEKLSYEASHDALTGLYNRVEFERRVGKLLAASRQDDSEHALCFLDLDRFKAINDTCGHAAGDQLLQSLGLLMESRLRQSDILARLGGDEFGLLLEHCPLEQAWVIANELREAAHGFRFPWEGEEFSVGMSVGIVTLNATSGDVASVLSAADTACYIAKKRGRDRVHILETRGADVLGESTVSPGLIKGMEPARGPETLRQAAASGDFLPVWPGAKPDPAEHGAGNANLNAVGRQGRL